jgi:superfamily II DNA/RNA helicase
MRLMKLNLILASDLLSRGVDLPDVKLVINFDMPLTQAEYFHRIGRSGRFGAAGLALSLITNVELKSYHYIDKLLPTMQPYQ